MKFVNLIAAVAIIVAATGLVANSVVPETVAETPAKPEHVWYTAQVHVSERAMETFRPGF